LSAGERIDLISTHSKYAPSQAEWLVPLDGVVDASDLDGLSSAATELCRFQGSLISVPRNVDVRVLWARSDRAASVPQTWQELIDSALVFGFSGRESGLFGFFFELVTAGGGRIFDDQDRPQMGTEEAVAAVEALVALGRRGPADLPSWHYDDVDAALADGRVDVAATWPGAYNRIRSSPSYDRLEPHLYPAGTAGRFSYAGCHSFALPRTCGDHDGAVALLRRLTGYEAGRIEGASGGIPAHLDAMAATEPVDDKDERRLAIIRETMATAMITYPALECFPAIEDAGWMVINAALRGELTAAAAVVAVQAAAEAAITRGSGTHRP
jgi:multiple sugar transport system substrate-binding protein